MKRRSFESDYSEDGDVDDTYSEENLIDKDIQKVLFRPRHIRKVLPLTRLKRLNINNNNNNNDDDNNNAGRVSRDSLPVIRLKKNGQKVNSLIVKRRSDFCITRFSKMS
jgi:hypothetical protein